MTQISADAQTRDKETYAIIGAAMEVHRHLGPGFLEAVYHQALAVEMQERQIPFRHEVNLPVHYKGIRLGCGYRADFVCFDLVLVEIKALEQLSGIEKAQVVNYLKATGLPRALLLNFGAKRLDYQRLILSTHLRSSASSVDQPDPESNP